MLVKTVLEKRIRKPGGLIYFSRLFDDNTEGSNSRHIRGDSTVFHATHRDNYQDFFNHDPAERFLTWEIKGRMRVKTGMRWRETS